MASADFFGFAEANAYDSVRPSIVDLGLTGNVNVGTGSGASLCRGFERLSSRFGDTTMIL